MTENIIKEAKLISVNERRAEFIDQLGWHYHTDYRLCRLTRLQPLNQFLETGKSYKLAVGRNRKKAIPIFEHPHDAYIEKICRDYPSAEKVMVPAKVLKAVHEDHRAVKHLTIELAPGVIVQDTVSGTMRGDFWEGTCSWISLYPQEYDKEIKKISIYITDYSRCSYPY